MPTKQEKREAWLKQMADPDRGRYKSAWWAGSLTAAELEEWILELYGCLKSLQEQNSREINCRVQNQDNLRKALARIEELENAT